MYDSENDETFTRKKLMLVEDEALIALSEIQELEGYGYEVLHILSGEEAVNYLRSNKSQIDLILMDINLGDGIDGTDAARLILEICDTPIIFLSSHTEPEIVEKTEMITSYGYIVKNTGITVIDVSIKMAFKLFDTKKRLQNKDTEYKTLFHSMLNGFAIHEMIFEDGNAVDYRFLDINKAFENITGLKSADVIGKTVKEVLPGIENDWLKTYAGVVNTGKPVSFTNFTSVFNKYFTVSAFPSGKNQFATIFNDITERIKAEKELKESEERFKALHNASFGGITIHDKGVILDCNQGLSNITGYTLEELIGMDGLLLISPKKRDFVMSQILAGYEEAYEAEGIRKNGEIYPVRLHAKNIPYKGKQVRVVEFRDISETKKVEQKLKLAYNEKAALLKELQHRAKNSFNTINGLLKLKSEIVHSEEARETLKELQTRVSAIADLYSQLYESGSPNSLFLDDYFNRIISSLKGLTNSYTIKLDAEKLETDSKTAATLGLIVTELITNSIKHAFPDNRPGIIEVAFQQKGDKRVLRVSDNGRGLPERIISGSSRGLGFKLVRVLSSQLEGTVELKGNESSGTDITITF